jgi:intracellular sulfur oxidation DsrE/DsrF family protein
MPSIALSKPRLAAALLLCAALLGPAHGTPPDAAEATPARAVFQISDADPAKWGLVLGNVANAQKALGKSLVVEVVVFGPGINALKNGSPLDARVKAAVANGVAFAACENSMAAFQLAPADMLPGVGFVHSGVVELIERQRQGYAYVRP